MGKDLWGPDGMHHHERAPVKVCAGVSTRTCTPMHLSDAQEDGLLVCSPCSPKDRAEQRLWNRVRMRDSYLMVGGKQLPQCPVQMRKQGTK